MIPAIAKNTSMWTMLKMKESNILGEKEKDGVDPSFSFVF